MNKNAIKIARIYLRVSTDSQSLERQDRVREEAKKKGYYIAKVYSESASGATLERPALQEMLADLQHGDVIIAERLDRLSRLPLNEAEKLMDTIKSKGAKISVPEILDLDVFEEQNEMQKVIAQSMQEMMLRIALLTAREDYELRRERQRQGIEIAKKQGKYQGKKANKKNHQRVIDLRKTGISVSEIAYVLNISISTVKRVLRTQIS